MAAGQLALPGTKVGPCLEPCHHIDCAATREMAAKVCKYCAEVIGYGRGFYMREDRSLVHSSCFIDHIDDEKAADNG